MENKAYSLKKTARLAGFMFLLYIIISILSMFLFNQATGDVDDPILKLSNIAQHAPLVRLTALLSLLSFFVALMLALSLYILTRDQNRNLAIMALLCRGTEGLIVAFSAAWMLGLLSVARASTMTATTDSAAAQVLGDFLLQQDDSSTLVSSICFAVGSTLYSYLFLRARSIPIMLAWFGIFASILLVVALPLQLAGFLTETVYIFIWVPMLVFEVTFALWLLIKGVTIPGTQ